MTEESGEFQMHLPFWIDTDAYSERDQDMFVAGYEFCQVVLVLEARGVEFRTTIHRENESRVRMAAMYAQSSSCGAFSSASRSRAIST